MVDGHPRGDYASLKVIGAGRKRFTHESHTARLVTRPAAEGVVPRYGALALFRAGPPNSGTATGLRSARRPEPDQPRWIASQTASDSRTPSAIAAEQWLIQPATASGVPPR